MSTRQYRASEDQLSLREYDPEHYETLTGAGFAPVAARVLAARGINCASKLDPDLAGLPGLAEGEGTKAVHMLAEAVRERRHVCVIGDYDADGMCAIVVAVKALEGLDTRVSWLVGGREYPERSLDPSLVNKAADMGADLLVTVDGGTSAHAGVAAAKKRKLKVIVTDHHKPDDEGPAPADALVNPVLEPMLDDGEGVNANLCGAAVALLLMRELYRHLGSEKRVGHLLDLVAIATVADVMPLDDVLNRKLVMNGLGLIRKGRCRNVFKSLLRSDIRSCDTNAISFKLAPLLNAANRLGKPHLGVEALLAGDSHSAGRLAGELVSHNRSRKMLSHRVSTAAIAAVDDPELPIVVHDEDWHEGVIGIAANNLTSEFNQPAIVLGGKPGEIRGSARSAGGVSMHEALSAVAAADPELLERWGGHEHAAGLKLRGSVERLRELLREHCVVESGEKRRTWSTDGELGEGELAAGSFERLSQIPWGRNFRAPSFVGDFSIEEAMPSGNHGFRYRLNHLTDGKTLPAWSRSSLGRAGEAVRLLYEVLLDRKDSSGLFLIPLRLIEG